MIVWGVNALNHASSLAVFNNNQLVFNRTSVSDELDPDTVSAALREGRPEHIYWYEQPWLKKLRQLRAGQWARAFDIEVLPQRYLRRLGLADVPITYTPHHASHAAAGYYTSDFDHAAIVVLDAIGEFESATIWRAQGQEITRVWSRRYPHSLGLFYSAFTQFLGFTPIQDEGKLEQLAQEGRAERFYHVVKSYFTGPVKLNYNFHRGVGHWPEHCAIRTHQDRCDVAAAVQAVFEQQIHAVSSLARSKIRSDNLVFMGGCAFNRGAQAVMQSQWPCVRTLSNPGDSASSMGCVLYHTGLRITVD